MGINVGSNAPPIGRMVSNTPDKCDFSFTVIEHLSWSAYNEKEKCFKTCDAKNKVIANREFKIKMPDGSIVPMKTDANGLIEIKGKEATAKFEVTFEPENAKLNNKFHLFHNDSAVIKPIET